MPLSVSKGWLQRFRNRFGLRNKNVIRKAVCADEEAAAKFLAVEKVNERKRILSKTNFNCNEIQLFWKKMLNTMYMYTIRKESLRIKH
jgi:hypothetical protein